LGLHNANVGTTKGDKMNPFKSYTSWRRYRQTCSALGRLSERGLPDIGMTRQEIRTAARKSL